MTVGEETCFSTKENVKEIHMDTIITENGGFRLFYAEGEGARFPRNPDLDDFNHSLLPAMQSIACVEKNSESDTNVLSRHSFAVADALQE